MNSGIIINSLTHKEVIICITILVSLFTLVMPKYIPESIFGFHITKKNREIFGIFSLLVAYYYWNNEKLF
jgi:hypothetical protein